METKPRLRATIIEIKGRCNAGHKLGDKFELDCYRPGGLCGFFYHAIFSSMQTFEYGGRMPWWQGNSIILKCPDPMNQISIQLEKSE